jgi:hypothetical protein
MARDKSKGKPRTGDGYKAKGKKPTETGIMQIRSADSASGSLWRHGQPKGWGVARVVDIFTRKERDGGK